MIERVLLTRFAPASIVANEQGEVFYIHGHTGAYLEPGTSEMEVDVAEGQPARANLTIKK